MSSSAQASQRESGQPGEEWRPLADRVAQHARDYLDGVAAVARGESGNETVSLLLLEVAQVMLAEPSSGPART